MLPGRSMCHLFGSEGKGRILASRAGPVRFGRVLLALHLCAELASLAGRKLGVAGSDLGLSAVASALTHADC